MSVLSNQLTWNATEEELDTLNKCLILLHDLSSDVKTKPKEALVRQTLCNLVADRCVKLHEMRIKLNQGKS